MLRCEQLAPISHMKSAPQKLLFTLALVMASAANPMGASAEQVRIPLGQQGNHWNVDRPRTGSSKNTVEMKFGAPLSASGPVGNPPIYTWEYDNFNVYFEGDYVIHSVVKYQPQEDASSTGDY